MSKIGYSLGLTAAVGVALVGVCLFQTESTFEDVGEQIALKLIEILPRKHHAEFQPSSKPVTDNRTEQRNRQPETKTSTAAAAASKASSFDPVGVYDAKEAMQRRYDALRETCLVYSDFMRPEKLTTETTPESVDALLHHPRSDVLLCPLQQVASKSLETLFTRIKEPGNEMEGKVKSFRINFPRSARDKKRAIVVRHPLERLVSAYRHNFEKSYNAATGQEEGGELTFPEFVDVVLGGHIEFAEFLEENEMTGESVAVDTGMIDGEGVSKAWNPAWRQCGVCHPDFQPHYILHMDHMKEDSKVLLEMMGHPRNSEDFLRAAVEPKSSMPEVEEHYFSMLTKSEIRQLHEKYKIDHELFGFSPDYYIAMGQDD